MTWKETTRWRCTENFWQRISRLHLALPLYLTTTIVFILIQSVFSAPPIEPAVVLSKFPIIPAAKRAFLEIEPADCIRINTVLACKSNTYNNYYKFQCKCIWIPKSGSGGVRAHAVSIRQNATTILLPSHCILFLWASRPRERRLREGIATDSALSAWTVGKR